VLPLLAVIYLATIPGKIEFSDTKITRNNKTENIKLPYSVEMLPQEPFLISFKLSVENTREAKFNLIPDNCIEYILINGKPFPLDGIEGLCDYGKGAYFDFSGYAQKGLNDFEIYIINHGGPGGLRIEAPYNEFKSLSTMHYFFALLLLISLALILRKFKFKSIAIAIILVGAAIRLIAYTYMGPTQFSFDAEAHLEYIQIVSEEKRVPKINETWSSFHPPLYYIVSAAIKNTADLFAPDSAYRILQQGQVLISFASIAFGVALIISLFGNCWLAYLAAFISVLWPGFVLAAPRIGNDGLFYLGALFCMFFAQRYWNLRKNLDVFLASLGASIALAAKSSGFVILAAWIIIYIFNALRLLKIASLRALFASIFVIALFAGLSNYRTIADIFEGKKFELVANSSGLNGGMALKNFAGNYMYFDLKEHITVPYITAWSDDGGRQYFWNYALKTSLAFYSNISLMNSYAGRTLATMLNILALLIFALALWGMMHAKAKEFPALFFTLSLFAALIYLRVSIPFASSNEFRHIMPVLFPLAYFAMRGTQILPDSRVRKFVYMALLSFAVLSFAFVAGNSI